MAKIKKVALYILVAALVLFIIFLPGYSKFMELRARNIRLEKEIERLEIENVKLYKEKKKLEEDIDYVEKVARESMGVTKEGEVPIRIEKE
ncbi:MAG: septum formation initiator family protein [Candidatus Omnitrophota bacterium]